LTVSRSSAWIRCQPNELEREGRVVELLHHAAPDDEAEVAARLCRTRVLGRLRRDLGELLAGQEPLADGLDASEPGGHGRGIGLRRDLDDLQPHFARDLREPVHVFPEVRFRFGLRHRVLGELLHLEPLDHELLAHLPAVLVAQARLGEVLAAQLLLVGGVAADALLGLRDRGFHLQVHFGIGDDDRLALRFALQQAVVDHLLEDAAAERVDLGRVGHGLLALLLQLLQEQVELLLDVADEHSLVVDHGRDGIERLRLRRLRRGACGGGSSRACGSGRRGGRGAPGGRGGEGDGGGEGEHRRRGGHAAGERQEEPP
jgi:hypothetical protein